MSNELDNMIEAVIGVEGRYSNNVNDPGGETMWGITKRTAMRHGYNGDMKSLPRETAKEIYLREYIYEYSIDLVAVIDQRIAAEMFDTGVNAGPATAIQMLQRSLNLLNRQGRDYNDVVVDGSLGPKTITSLKEFIRIRGNDGRRVLHTMLNVMQGAYYINIATKRMESEDFIFGWFRSRVVT